MEIAGTVIGVAGLAGLFSNSLEIFDWVSSAAKLGTTQEVLQVKIEVEKVRLLIWGQSIGLANASATNNQDNVVDKALDREYLRSAVASLLVCFVKIFEDSEKLRDRYGLVQKPATDAGAELETPSTQLLGSTFKRTYDKFKGSPAARQANTSLMIKVKWAVGDEKKLRELIEELKAINDSLNHLLPAIRDRTRVRMRTEIMQSNDEHQLQNLVNASDGVNDLISDTASLRLEMLSGRGVSLRAPPTQPRTITATSKTPKAVTAPIPSASSLQKRALQTTVAPKQPTPPSTASQPAPLPVPSFVPVQDPAPAQSQPLTVERTVIPVAPAIAASSPMPSITLYDDTGALVIHKVFSKQYVPSFFSWQIGVDDPAKPATTIDYSSPYSLRLAPENLMSCCQKLLEVEIEADPAYAGWAPGSVSLEGYSREYGFRRLHGDEVPAPTWLRAAATGSVLLDDILKRWKEIMSAGGLGTAWTEETGRKQVNNLIGYSEFVWSDPKEGIKLRHQIADLMASLSRTKLFPAFEAHGGSIGALALRENDEEYGFTDFIYQMLQAKELSLRLLKNQNLWQGGLTRKIIYDMIAAELWMRNMEPQLTKDRFDFTIRLEVRKKQVDAMLSFAEKMKWPFLAEARKTLNGFASDDGSRVDVRTWDWVAGMVLPGAICPLTLMFGLHQASPSLQNTPPAGTVQIREANFGLVFPQVSYWRSRSILGKVLAPMTEHYDICGWVGPCVSPAGLETYRTPAALLQIHTRTPVFRLQESAPHPAFVPSDSSQGITPWEDPALPPASLEVCILQKIHMTVVPSDTNTTNPEGNVASYRAKLDFYLLKANKVITLTLYGNSVFIAAPKCTGIHRIDPKAAINYARNILEVEQLDKAELETERLTVINATGRGAEAVARAWCSERSTNAVVWRKGSGCCYKCALMATGKDGLDVDILILT